MEEAAKTSTAEVWRERISSQQSGGQSIRALCKENGWHEHAFYWWRSRLGLSPVPAIGRARRPKASAGFTEIVMDRPAWPSASLAEPILLRLGGGRELVLPVSMADERVASLVRLIEAKPSIVGASR